MSSRRVGLPPPRGRLPLHPNRAHAALPRPPSSVHSAAGTLLAAESTPPSPASTTLPTKRHRSPSSSPSPSPASPSPPRTPPPLLATAATTPSSSHIPPWQLESPHTSHSLLDLARASPPPDPSMPLLTAFLAGDTVPTYSVDALIASPLQVPQVLSPEPSPPSPRYWTLAEVIDRCTTWEEYQQHRPTGFSALQESWAVVDAAMRKRHHKQLKESWSVVFKRVRSNIKRNIESRHPIRTRSSDQRWSEGARPFGTKSQRSPTLHGGERATGRKQWRARSTAGRRQQRTG